MIRLYICDVFWTFFLSLPFLSLDWSIDLGLSFCLAVVVLYQKVLPSWLSTKSRDRANTSDFALPQDSFFMYSSPCTHKDILPQMHPASRIAGHHMRRPCDRCRQRKSRCVRELGKQNCTLCSLNDLECTFAHGPRPRKRTARERSPRDRREESGYVLYQFDTSYLTIYQASNPHRLFDIIDRKFIAGWHVGSRASSSFGVHWPRKLS